MNLSARDLQLVLAVIVAILALAGLLALRGWLRVVVFVAGLLVCLYLLGFLPSISL